MARVSLTTQARSGFRLAPTLAGPPTSDGDIIDVGARLWVDNGRGATITVTVVTAAETSGLAIEDVTETVAAGASALLGPFGRTLFQQPDDAAEGAGRVLVNYSAFTSVTRAAVST